MEIVENQNEGGRKDRDLIQQDVQRGFDGRRLGDAREASVSSDRLGHPVHRSDEMGQKTRGIVIPFVQGEPCDRTAASGRPLAD
ncbi:hypothetical protein OMP38_27405 [Cohnella ginsengisoli]|uniref:Uncharacterized protein n=1 Tax=Cohnella ginsengisoli TaxID=425004 RepID=A0A9X4KKW6_9BACL|nr:hypothetical protein [Cohnella ginsengisoli]MDG0794144.1 hypothetical protein [Cohnella ginsengisoli]